MFKNLTNKLLGRYASHDEAIIISCFFNPMGSKYRLDAFERFYNSISHLNNHIVECVIGDSKPQLAHIPSIQRVYSDSLLWHKEALLNGIISRLDPKYKYVFWVDADVFFTNRNWLVEGVKELQNGAEIIQPFEYCIHLNKDEIKPSFNVETERGYVQTSLRHKEFWRSFCASYVDDVKFGSSLASSENYDRHGHVGFAWGANRNILESVPLYDKALIGGADHIIAHAAAGHIPHKCIDKSFTEDLTEVYKWSNEFYSLVQGEISFVKGDLYHIWHGDIEKRQYLKRIKDFTPKTKKIRNKDKNGLYMSSGKDDQVYITNYFKDREVTDNSFFNSMVYGYLTDDGLIGGLLGRNLVGGMVGDALNNSEEKPLHTEKIEHHSETNSLPLDLDMPLEKDNHGSIDNSCNENFS